ncbi:hypothetical protein [Streptomyces sp. V1I1]|uniref:hypothetical protein n=1 Tax=Streptomyces sp. V1I1 TaxID=3042272 RepID=UPI0027817F2E|nr:hypothetical protein [Streptomyces sp. V1I1]MDQ0943142.1 hypothetical protein [Streptomyces sp. V1I1]
MSGSDDGGWYLIGGIVLLVVLAINGAIYGAVALAKGVASHWAELLLYLGLSLGGVAVLLGALFGYAYFLDDRVQHWKTMRTLKREAQERQQRELERVHETKRKLHRATKQFDKSINRIKKWKD